MSTPFLTMSGIGYAAGARTILSGIDLTLQHGRIYGLVGPNGSGKSTLMKIIARQIAPVSGTLTLAGRAAAEWGGRAFARNIAYMPQFTPATDGMTVRELVSLGRFPWHGTLGRFGKVDRDLVDDAISRTDLDEFSDRMVANMSGGERQRAWIAMMLAQNARCLLLDEPTSALDLAHQASVLSLVQSLSHERGLSVVIVLHDINLAARYCDEIIALNRGRITAQGTPAEIMHADLLHAIFGVGMGVFSHPARGEPVSYLL
ncbi:ATP-binding cassette domain-containing protein (plasmid) [Rhizobium sullae]|uniref:ATP-binding cassette domain-containing protein n=2 Tax=Rhizobium sullae TaxID=50338 RepID=A0A2N0DC97_RHISU|nr:ATP-binding cassette domain-containing protein [Rhizobium sullae]PKA43731.1 iron ABC transporter substrate-binding protein [Rhizobium sullae]UWU18844.1 ATP-binding cassette domain-containing protein [Rhizobium sullae]